MNAETISDQIERLPPDARREVSDFVAFLLTRYEPRRPSRTRRRGRLSQEPFVGTWDDREEMTDSSAWVRQVRRQEWE